MSQRFKVVLLLLTLLALLAPGCRSDSEVAVGKSIRLLPGADLVFLPGPSSIRPDGSVRNRRLDTPNGRLLKTTTATALRHQQVDSWGRNQVLIVAANHNLKPDQVEGWILITGPRELPVSEDISAQVYDVTLEIWKRAEVPRKRQREVE